MFFLSSFFANPDSILSRRDAVLRTAGVALRTLFDASVVIVGLRVAGVWAPAALLPLAGLVALAASALAWRHMSVRILPDGITRLTGRALLAIAIALVVALAGAVFTAGALDELVLLGVIAPWSPYLIVLAAQLVAVASYAWCMGIVRRRQFGPSDAQESCAGEFVASVVGDLIGAAVEARSSGD